MRESYYAYLKNIINKLKNNKIHIITNNTFNLYKNNEKKEDIYKKYFKIIDTIRLPIINYTFDNLIFNKPYNSLNFLHLKPYIDRYFSQSHQIEALINTIEKKYNVDYNNTCCIFYRGLDKQKETIIPSYKEMYDKALYETRDSPNITYLLQTDESEFFEFGKNILNNYFMFNDEIRHISHCNSLLEYECNKTENFKYSCYFLAIVIIMSRCKYIVYNSSNISLWISLFRGNCNNVYQYLNQSKLFHECINNPLYDENCLQKWY